jgi:hypothetical protein
MGKAKQPSNRSALNRWENEGGALKAGHHSGTKRRSPVPEAATSLYYFNIRKNDGFVEDPEGLTLVNLAAVRQQALNNARNLISEGDLKGEDRRGWRFEITDRAHQPVLTVRFSEALETQ